MTAPQSATAADRALSAFRRLVTSVYPAAVYWIVHEYVVVESDGLTFSGTPTDPSFSPALPTNVPYSPALAGSSCVVPAGTLAYVGFANADPAKPFLVRFGAASIVAPGLPTSITMNAASAEVNGVTVPGVLTLGPSADAVVLANATPVSTSPSAAASERRVVCYGDVVVVGTATGPMTLATVIGSQCSKVRA